MKKRLLNLLIEYTRCSVSINDGKISLEWTWQGNSLEMGFTRARRYANHNGSVSLRDGNIRI